MTELKVLGKFWLYGSVLLFAAVQSQGALAFGSKKADSAVWVSRSDGATQCGMTPVKSLEADASELQKSGVKVLSSRKGNDGKMHAMACGMPKGFLNVYEIPREDLPKALSLGFQEEPQK
jgi:hypothetical protein